jgi:hypothetical protein
VLHAEPAEDLDAAVVHAHRDRKAVLAHRVAQKLARALVEVQDRRHLVELRLRHLEGIHALDDHDVQPSCLAMLLPR